MKTKYKCGSMNADCHVWDSCDIAGLIFFLLLLFSREQQSSCKNMQPCPQARNSYLHTLASQHECPKQRLCQTAALTVGMGVRKQACAPTHAL